MGSSGWTPSSRCSGGRPLRDEGGECEGNRSPEDVLKPYRMRAGLGIGFFALVTGAIAQRFLAGEAGEVEATEEQLAEGVAASREDVTAFNPADASVGRQDFASFLQIGSAWRSMARFPRLREVGKSLQRLW
jgi:hypothetical protein